MLAAEGGGVGMVETVNRYGISFWGDKIFWNLRWWLYNIVNVLNATELFTLKWLILLHESHLNK